MTVPVVTAPPVPGCLVMTAEPSSEISASVKPGRRTSCRGEEGVVAAGGLRAALQDVARGHRPSEPVVVAGAQSNHQDAGPLTSAASVTRPVTTTSAPARRQAVIPAPPR
ncbi:hypothetical protein Snoj_83510 [Streptomyces nojiriensis]|uniref:Uncharacterized protein n=1 Tax=Streptomyces nojiriensis TaxID=66374 RepID=A0ABQ3T209_9ACTN|nr:hypothetical protein Snoj_83510 [Streptomyces nojiriensis]